MKLTKRVALQRQRRAFRVRNAVRASGRLRLSVYRSNKNIYAQIIDDTEGKTLVAASTVEKSFRSSDKNGGNVDAAVEVGKLLGQRAKEKGITKVAFDRGVYRYHGRLQALADAAREAGLEF